MLENLRSVYSGYLLEKEDPLTVLLVDDGTENKGFVCEAIENKEIQLNRLVAQKYIFFSNSMIEAVNKRMKYDFLFRNTCLQGQQQTDILEIIEDRHAKRSTIIASQLPVASWFDVIGEGVISNHPVNPI